MQAINHPWIKRQIDLETKDITIEDSVISDLITHHQNKL